MTGRLFPFGRAIALVLGSKTPLEPVDAVHVELHLAWATLQEVRPALAAERPTLLFHLTEVGRVDRLYVDPVR